MMTFTSGSFPWLIVPALALTGVAGSAVLLTNLQTANLFGRKRHVVVSLYVGAAYSNGLITWMMKLSHFSGVNVQTSFMFLTIGIVPMLVSTVAFLPKTHIPWPLPADYGKRRNQSLDENLIRKQRAWQRRMSEDLDPDIDPQMFPDSSQLTDYDSTEAGMVRCRRPPPSFTPSAVQPLFVWSLLWYGIHRLHEAIYETGVVEMADLEIMGPLAFVSHMKKKSESTKDELRCSESTKDELRCSESTKDELRCSESTKDELRCSESTKDELRCSESTKDELRCSESTKDKLRCSESTKDELR
ncbi:solute carrier family 43 member 3 [Biomphalaria glabrata]|nr:solute carrier family 43 member 3-like [Biomphalaria glabrata]